MNANVFIKTDWNKPCCHPWRCWETQSTWGQCLHPEQSTWALSESYLLDPAWNVTINLSNEEIYKVKVLRREWISCLNCKLCTVNWTGSALQNTGCWCTIFPFPSGRMEESKQFIIAHWFGVQIVPERLPSHVEVGFVKSF